MIERSWSRLPLILSIITVGYQLRGIKIRLMTLFNPGVFRRPNEASMGLFKAFCERQRESDQPRST